MGKFYYNIEKIETKTKPVVINLTKVKKTGTVDDGKQPRTSNRQILEQILARLDNVDKRLDDVEKRLDVVDKRLERHDELFWMVLDQFKEHKWID